MYYFNDDKFIMEITRCVVGEQSEPTLWQFVRARKIRIPYNITAASRSARQYYYSATNETNRDVTVHAVNINSLYIE